MSAIFGTRSSFAALRLALHSGYPGLTPRALFWRRFAAETVRHGTALRSDRVARHRLALAPRIATGCGSTVVTAPRRGCIRGRFVSTTIDLPVPSRGRSKPNQSLASWWPKSKPKCGSDFVPVIFTGTSVPAPCLLKKGSTGFSRMDLNPVVMCESLACRRAFP